jgi:hypothetical protein
LNLKLKYGGRAKFLVPFPFGGCNGCSVTSSTNTVSMPTRVTRHIICKTIFFLWLYGPILGLGRFHEAFSFISVTRSATVGRTPWTCDQLVARPLLTAPGDCDDDGEFGGMKIGSRNRSTRRKPAPTPLCPQIPLARPGL